MTTRNLEHESETPLYTPTGHRDLDLIFNGGLAPGQLAVISGRTSHGKTTLALDMIRRTALRDGRPVLFVSAEQIEDEITMRLLAAEATVPLAAIRADQMIDEQLEKLTGLISPVENAPIFIEDSARTLEEIIVEAHRLSEDHDLGLIVVDGLNLLVSGEDTNSRYEDVATMSRNLKHLARELNTPVVVTAGLSRGIEERGDDALPRLRDLRDSGTLEEDADIVIFVNRPDAANPDHERAGEAFLVVAKHRAGSTGAVNVAHQMHFSRFMDLAPRE
ncbi:MAG: DnaB-like helicase C-terminal domain-containing protein [Acidipropionibacterium jensenii]|uniref:DnaB-like helicase C-terminal domain-containing protein n=1 Tax=Acidipropionibacterium jensenii TaxID=1749 RepID=UPI002647C305|nr:DnaB-like helicase C-terminal domain-containing protein [Acidipropionibacterium jensenii]MDN6440453.1 DnaB-like helicase C-terminal domain-containing protein [Acidipropionibacterium jensenii]